MVEDKNLTIEKVMDKFETIHNRIKFKAFGKVTIGTNKSKVRRQEEDNDDETEEEKARLMLEEQENIVDEELKNIREAKYGKAEKIWAIRKKVIGGEKADSLATAIDDPVNKHLVTNKTQIKDTILKYCIETLSNNEAEDRFKDEIEKKTQDVHNVVKNKGGMFETSKKHI